MALPNPNAIKMVGVNAEAFESVCYIATARQLYIKFRNAPVMCFDNVPGFRHEGLMAAPRKDAYYKSFIENKFLARPADPP